MKIAYFNTHFPYRTPPARGRFPAYYGGAENVAYNLAVHMAKRGHEVSIFTTSVRSQDSVEEYDGLKVCRYGTNLRIEKGYFSLNLFRKPWHHQMDIIHAHISTPPADLAGLACARRSRVPLVVTYHGDGEVGYGRWSRRAATFLYNSFLLHRVLSAARVIISPSQSYIPQSPFLGKWLDKVIAVNNGVNIEDFEVPYSKQECRERLGLPTQAKVILFVGVLLKYKGPEVLIRAMAQVARRIPEVRLVLLGDGAMRGELEHLARSLEVEKQVRFAGFVGGASKTLYYKAADIFVLPSIMGPEIFAIALLEASAAGLPLVVSDLPAFRDLIREGYNALVTPRGEVDSLASAMVRLLEDEDLSLRLAQNARERAGQFSWGRIAEETEGVYERVLKGREVRGVV